jgi:hypothetical protein
MMVMKGQSSTEIIFCISFIILVFTFISVDVADKERMKNENNEIMNNINTCSALSSEISSVYILGYGSESHFYLEKNATFFPGGIKIENHVCGACCNVTNSIDGIQLFEVESGWVLIKNYNNMVVSNEEKGLDK